MQFRLTRPEVYFLKIMEFSHYNEYGVAINLMTSSENGCSIPWKVNYQHLCLPLFIEPPSKMMSCIPGIPNNIK